MGTTRLAIHNAHNAQDDSCHHCLHSNEDERHTVFYNLLRGVAGSELVIREDMALATIRAGSAEEFSPYEMQQLLRRCEEECEIMRSRGNIYSDRSPVGNAPDWLENLNRLIIQILPYCTTIH